MPTQIYNMSSIISMYLLELVICHYKRELQSLESVVCMDNPVWFSFNIKVCAPIMVTAWIWEQAGEARLDLKFFITRMVYRIFSLTTNISTVCFLF